MRQGDASRFEEYVTLRQELLELHAFCRQILYWTALLVAASMAWYMGNATAPGETPAVDGYTFIDFNLTILLLSLFLYVLYVSSIYRIGSYIAVFWDSDDADTQLRWHRINRQASSVLSKPEKNIEKVRVLFAFKSMIGFKVRLHGLLPEVGLWVYLLLAAFLVLFTGFFKVRGDFEPWYWMWVLLGIIVLCICAFPMALADLRRTYERSWRLLKGTAQLQEEVQKRYLPLDAGVSLGDILRDGAICRVLVKTLISKGIISEEELIATAREHLTGTINAKESTETCS